MKRVLIHTLIFSPDGVSTAYLYNDIALRLQQSGYEVVVLTTTDTALQYCAGTGGEATHAMEEYASTFPHCSMKSTEYLWPKTKRLVKDERRSKSKLRVCA